MAFETDEVIAATGFTAPLEDLPALGVATFGQSRLPAQTANWESASVPGIFFAGTIGQGAKGLQKHGIPANSGAVQGARYNARTLAAHIARDPLRRGAPATGHRRLGRWPTSWPTSSPADPRSGTSGPTSPGSSAWTRPPASSTRASARSATFVDEAGPDALAITLESDGSTHVYPVLYSRVGGTLTEHRLDPDPLLDYRTDATRREIDAVLGRFGAGARSGGV